MKKRKNFKSKENGRASTCPHCGAGADGITLGLYWDFDEHCWRCVICGYRGYEDVLRPKSKAEIAAERVWDDVLNFPEKEENYHSVHCG